MGERKKRERERRKDEYIITGLYRGPFIQFEKEKRKQGGRREATAFDHEELWSHKGCRRGTRDKRGVGYVKKKSKERKRNEGRPRRKERKEKSNPSDRQKDPERFRRVKGPLTRRN